MLLEKFLIAVIAAVLAEIISLVDQHPMPWWAAALVGIVAALGSFALDVWFDHDDFDW